MTTGFFLIISILILGGVIATAGDRIGMKVGKSRLSLFNLRPRQTATLITILTGGVISASTLGILFAMSDQLRRGVFDLEEIQAELETARDELTTAEADLNTAEIEKRQIERELARARADRRDARQRLQNINKFLNEAIARQDQTQRELQRVESNFESAQQRLQEVSQETRTLQAEIVALEQESREIIEDRDRQIAVREEEIAEKGAQLQSLEVQRARLTQELFALEREIQALREGSVALLNNQVLAAGVVRISEASEAPQVVDQLLRRANQLVLQELLPGTSSVRAQVIQITNTEVERLLDTLQPGNEYVVRILAGSNYLVGEPCVVAGQTCIQVTANAVPNLLLFQPNEVIAATTVESAVRSQEELAEKLEFLIAATQFRAKQAGVLGDSIRISDNQEEAITYFFEKFTAHQQTSTQDLTVRAIATQPIFTTGPLSIKIDAIQSGTTLFSTDDVSPPTNN
jgi:uncharacterized protein (DUF3084 family)